MTKNIRVLLAGESWVSNSTHYKGWDFFSSTIYETGISYLQQSLIDSNIELIHLPSHLAAETFPFTVDELDQYDVVVLSDIGANTLLLPPDVWLRGKSVPNRLKVLKDWVIKGGGFAMCGGYYSFAGIYGGAKYYRSVIEEILPTYIYPFDDRLETPEGVVPDIKKPDHPVLIGMPMIWPALLGFNELKMKEDAELLATVGDHPLLAVRQAGAGRTLAWSSDIGPHWCPETFVKWFGYGQFWKQAFTWLAGK